MRSFTHVSVTWANYDKLASKLSGEVDSFENPNHCNLTGEFNIIQLEKSIGKTLELSGYSGDGPNFPKSISMKLTAVEDGTLTFISSATQG